VAFSLHDDRYRARGGLHGVFHARNHYLNDLYSASFRRP
jgi:hypothetical protein